MPSLRQGLALCLLVPGLAPAMPAQAQPLSGPAVAAARSEATPEARSGSKPKPDAIDTEHLFGFTEGADAGDAGEQEVVLDTVTRIGKRRAGPGPTGYESVSTKFGYQYNPADHLSVELGLFGDHHRVRNVLDLDDRNAGTFDGVSLEVKYQFLKSTTEHPFGVAIETRPRFARVLPIEGRGADIFDFENVLQFDWQIVPGKLWYGGNVSFDPAAGRQRGAGEGYRSSTLTLSGVLITKLGDSTYLGPELRYLRGYDGTFLNRLSSEALFLGPALHHRFSEKAWITLAYSPQIWGRDTGPALSGREFGLNQFERHTLRVKAGVEF